MRRLRQAGAREAAIERGDGPVVDALLDSDVTVVVTSPNRLNLRGRYRPAGSKDDRFDSFVLADALRTDRAPLRPLEPDSPATVTLRAAVRARCDLVGHRVAACNQLRTHLQTAFPGAVGLSVDLDSPISLAFLARLDCQDREAWLSSRRLAAWLAAMGYRGRNDPADLHARLAAAPPGATGDDAAQARITRALLAVLTTLVAQIKALEAQITEQLTLHADARISTSLPRAGTVRAARILIEIGDCRARYHTPEALICAAGVAPSTRRSGKIKVVSYRWAAEKELRDEACDFVRDSRRASPWAARLYCRAPVDRSDQPHAMRILARAWLYVIRHCWQDSTAYDPARRRALERIISQNQPAAA